MKTPITDADAVPEHGSYRFTVRESDDSEQEVILVRFGDGIAAWKNFCRHETDQRLDRGVGNGAAMREGAIICPKHGSAFDAESGYCDNGPAAGSTLAEVAVTVEDGTVYLTDDDVRYLHDGGTDDDDAPGSTSHLRF